MSKHLPESPGFKSEEAGKFPSLILIASASPCNLGCPGCPSEVLRVIRETKGVDNQPELYLRPEYYKKIADECAAHTAPDFQPRIRISGYGEPTLQPKLVEMIEYSCRIGVKTSLITNGILLTEEKAVRMLQAGIESVEFSVDAHTEKLYDQIRPPITKKVPSGNFSKLVANVKKFIEVRNTTQKDRPKEQRTFVIASAVRGPQNYAVTDQIDAFWKATGVDHVSIRKFLTWGIPELETMQKTIGEQSYLQPDSPCPYPFERCMVDPGGFVRLCPYDDQRKIPEFGHIAKITIAELWQSERWNRIRACHGASFSHNQAIKDAPLCANCQDRVNRSWTFNYISIADSQS